ncbi:MAG: hypothetical protein WBN57_03185 [Gammaproteobacteria bacterium]
MYIDNLTLASLVLFGIALGSFIKVCVIDSCITDSDADDDDR